MLFDFQQSYTPLFTSEKNDGCWLFGVCCSSALVNHIVCSESSVYFRLVSSIYKKIRMGQRERERERETARVCVDSTERALNGLFKYRHPAVAIATHSRS